MKTKDIPRTDLDAYIKSVINRKEKSLLDNADYNKFESLFHRHTAGKYLGDFIYGANDGIITTFAIVAGAIGASLPSSVVLILGFANIVADGISMGASNYLGKKSEKDYAQEQRKNEEWEIENLRDIEIEEVKDIYEKKGFKGKDLERVVEVITSDKKVWVDVMMKEELGIIEETGNDPSKHGVVTFLAFVVAGIVPLLPFIIPGLGNPFMISAIFGGFTLFTVGALRHSITVVSWFRGGLEVLLIGSGAALGAFFIGKVVENLIA